ncbi:MAG: DUF4091 domain-containing protein [Phycisphaerae bacterium]|jgi:hypothetical protein|nr:DUF4091 domain-containing protein [Phycisphaerae bacterium]
MWRTSICVLLIFGGVAFGASRKLAITADVGICAHPREVALNTGGSGRVRIKSDQHYYLFNFDVSAVKSWRITKATLHLKLANGRIRRAAVCTVPIPWVEGTAGGKAQNGSSCFTHVKYPTTAWTPGGGTVTDATFNSPDMMWRPASVQTDKDGWMAIRIDPKLVQAVAAGFSHGLILSSETGQTRENHDVFTREQGAVKPYLTVACVPPLPKPIPQRPLARAASCTHRADFKSGAISVLAGMPSGMFANKIVLSEKAGGKAIAEKTAFHGREVVFAGLKPGRKYHVNVISLLKQGGGTGMGGSLSATASEALAAPKAIKLPAVEKIRSVKNAGWRLVPLSAAARAPITDPPAAGAIDVPHTPRGAWVGFQVAICPPKGAAADISVKISPLEHTGQLELVVPPLRHVKIYRVWSVPKDGKNFGEVLVPLRKDEKFSIPWAQNKITGQKCQTIFVDIWAPAAVGWGEYVSDLTVSCGGRRVAVLPLKIELAGAALSDSFHIAADMNTYSSPARALGARNSDAKAFIAAERKYYRLAHAHRMTLAVLPYSQDGSIAWRGAPKLSGAGAKCKVTDWSDWDERFGPLLDGSAFALKKGYVGPGAGRGLRNIYLPLHENWPSPLGKNFRPFPPPRDYQKMLEWTADLPPIENCVLPGVSAAWINVLTDFRKHLADKGWTKTQYQVYLNNKYYFRRNNGRGVSLWLLDEPMAADDFLALRYFGRITAQAAKLDSPTPLQFRLDISRPTHQRDWLDGVVDLNVCANQLYSQRRLIARRKRVFGETYWNYRMPGSFESDNVGWAVWPVRSLCWGATGTVPWQTIGSDGDLLKADATALMYPGWKFGLNEPLASIRMKAWRQGLQDAELLRILKEKRKFNDLQLRAFVAAATGLKGSELGMDPGAEASIATFSGMTDDKLSTLRRAVLQALGRL